MRIIGTCSVALLALSACQEASIGTRNSVPTVSITSHFDGDQVVEAFPFVVRASAGDSDNKFEDLVATWYASNDLIGECNKIPINEDGVVECEVVLFTTSEPPRVSVDVRDPRGATGSAAVELEVVPGQADPEAPSAEILSPAADAQLLGGEPVIFEGNVSDLQDPATAISVEWSSTVDGVLWTQQPDSNGSTTFVQPTLSSGSHGITLRATDTDGNVASDTILIDVNGAPSAPVVSIAPNPASSSQDLTATIDSPSIDPEGDPISYTYEWLKDGVPQGGLTSSLVLATNTSRGETWTVRVHPSDGNSTGPFGEDQVMIENAPPVVNSVVISPDPAYTDDVLSAVTVVVDPDGDAITENFDWHVNGYSTGQTGATLDGTVWFDKGDLVQLFVTPNDGSLDGNTLGSNVVTIANSPPTEPVVSIAPTTPIQQVDDLLCSIDTPSTDPDPGDTVTYTFEWDVDGVAYPDVGHQGPFQTTWIDDTADGADTLELETWTCSVTAEDQTGLGSIPGQDSVVIGTYVFLPDYNGLFDVLPPVAYSCQDNFFGITVVNINVSQLTFSEVGGTLTVSGAPTPMTQTPSPVDENFSATGVIAGGCDETYIVSGSFSDNDNWAGTLQVSFTGSQCGLTNCTNQVWPVSGVRVP